MTVKHLLLCEKYRCYLREEMCIKYQEEVARAGSNEIQIEKSRGHMILLDRGHCVNCAQGRQVIEKRKGMGGIKVEEKEFTKKQCKLEGCELKAIARGLCGKHYDEWRRGEPELAKLMGGPFEKVITVAKPSKPKPQAKKESKIAQDLPDPSSQSEPKTIVDIPHFERDVMRFIAERSNRTVEEVMLSCVRKGIVIELEEAHANDPR
jgi:hypothetical protein